MDSAGLPAGYRLADGPPTVADYLLLRERAGLSLRRQDQAQAALAGSWAAVHVLYEVEAKTVGMGRLLGDGGWYFHVVDMAVLPSTSAEVSATPSSPSYSSGSAGKPRRART